MNQHCIQSSTTSLSQSLRFQPLCLNWQRLWSVPWGWPWASWASWWALSSSSEVCAQVGSPDTRGPYESHFSRKVRIQICLIWGHSTDKGKWEEVMDTNVVESCGTGKQHDDGKGVSWNPLISYLSCCRWTVHLQEQKNGHTRWPRTLFWPSSSCTFSPSALLCSPLLWEIRCCITSEFTYTLDFLPWLCDIPFSSH